MKKIFGLVLLAIVVFSACDENKNSGLIFSNNMESSIAWNGNKTPNSYHIIKFDNAFSGEYVCKLDSANPYSVTFNMQLKNISRSKLSLVRMSAWFMLPGDGSEQNLVAEIRDSNENTLEWLAKDVKDFGPAINQWAKILITVDLTLNQRNNPDNYIRVYACNGKRVPIFVDDLFIEFE